MRTVVNGIRLSIDNTQNVRHHFYIKQRWRERETEEVGKREKTGEKERKGRGSGSGKVKKIKR